MPSIEVVALRCNDRKPEDGHFGGYISWELLVEAMRRQSLQPFEERIRPCLKFNDWWIYYAPTCQKCEKAVWELDMDGQRVFARPNKEISGKRVELLVRESGEILNYIIGKGFEF